MIPPQAGPCASRSFGVRNSGAAQQNSGAARQNSDSFYHFSGISHLSMAKTPAQYRQTPTHHGQTPAHRRGAGAWCSELFLQQTEVMPDIPVCVHLSSSAAPGILWNSTILLCIHRIAFLHFLTAVMPRAGNFEVITTDCTKSFSLTGWRILRCLRSVFLN